MKVDRDGWAMVYSPGHDEPYAMSWKEEHVDNLIVLVKGKSG